MDCSEVTDRLWEYLDGELAAEEAAAVGQHLTECRYCRLHHRCDRAFLVLLVGSLNRACRAPATLRVSILASLAKEPLER